MRSTQRMWISTIRTTSDGIGFVPEYGDIICLLDFKENEDGSVERYSRINIPQRIKHHSPTGMGWGYLGSGPAEFALNIMALYLPTYWRGEGQSKKNFTETWDGKRVSDDAFALHQEFKQKFVAELPIQGGVIPGSIIKAFLRDHDINWNLDLWRVKAYRSGAGDNAKIQD